MAKQDSNKRAVRLQDVADRAGVSLTAASLALNGKAGSGIPQATQQRVLDAARELSYRPNALARGLRQQKSMSIGFVGDKVATHPFVGAMIQGAQDVAWRAGFVLMVINTGGDVNVERAGLKALLERRVDGVIYATMFHQMVTPPSELTEVPFVLLDARTDDCRISSVAPDDAGGSFSAVTHLIQAGHRRIGFVQADVDVPAATERLAGYRRALEETGIGFDPSLILHSEVSVDGAEAAALQLLESQNPPTAIFCFNDEMAAGVYRAADRAGLRIPESLSVVGFDDTLFVTQWLEPGLTTMRLPHYEMGQWAVEQLLSLIEGDNSEVECCRLSCPLVQRNSVAAPLERVNE